MSIQHKGLFKSETPVFKEPKRLHRKTNSSKDLLSDFVQIRNEISSNLHSKSNRYDEITVVPAQKFSSNYQEQGDKENYYRPSTQFERGSSKEKISDHYLSGYMLQEPIADRKLFLGRDSSVAGSTQLSGSKKHLNLETVLQARKSASNTNQTPLYDTPFDSSYYTSQKQNTSSTSRLTLRDTNRSQLRSGPSPLEQTPQAQSSASKDFSKLKEELSNIFSYSTSKPKSSYTPSSVSQQATLSNFVVASKEIHSSAKKGGAAQTASWGFEKVAVRQNVLAPRKEQSKQDILLQQERQTSKKSLPDSFEQRWNKLSNTILPSSSNTVYSDQSQPTLTSSITSLKALPTQPKSLSSQIPLLKVREYTQILKNYAQQQDQRNLDHEYAKELVNLASTILDTVKATSFYNGKKPY